MPDPVRWLAVLVLAVAGLGIATPFTLAYYGRLAPRRLGVPEALCRTGESDCRSVLGTPDARIFGVPNSLLGMAFYAGLLALAVAAFGGAAPAPWVHSAAALAAWGTVALGIYLAWSLLFRLRQPCRLCFAAHIINLALAVLLSVWRAE